MLKKNSTIGKWNRLGLEKNLDILIYAKTEFSFSEMGEIRLGLEKDLDVSIYAKSDFNQEEMKSIRLKLGEK